MATKLNPGEFNCYSNALPDEPFFTILARDAEFYDLVMEWAERRRHAIERGTKPASDNKMVEEAEECAHAGAIWRRENYGKWRQPVEESTPDECGSSDTKT